MRTGWLGLITAFVGCGRHGFEAIPAAVDASIDAATAHCWGAWRSGAPTLSAPRPLAELNTSMQDRDPFLAADQRTLYFGRGPLDSGDLFVATRATAQASFGPASQIAELLSSGNDSKMSVTDDGLVTVFATSRPGGPGGSDLWQASRSTTDASFANLDFSLLANVNGSLSEFDPQLSGDGRRLYFTLYDGSQERIYAASRGGISDAFDAPQPVPGLPIRSGDPAVAPDELTIIYTEYVSGNFRLRTARRDSNAEPFFGHVTIPGLAGTWNDSDAELTDDGCTLLFASTRLGSYDLHVVDVLL